MRRSAAFPAVLLALSLSARGQEVAVRSDLTRRDEIPGVAAGVYSFTVSIGTVAVDYVEIQTAHPRLSVEPVIPPGGPSAAVPLATLGGRPRPVAAMGWAGVPGLREGWTLPGMVLAGDRLIAWPPEGEQVVLQAEGAIGLGDVPRGTFTLTAADGVARPLLSLNGALPAAPGEMAVYTGALSRSDLPAASWTENLALVPLTPDDPRADPHALFLDREQDEGALRTWRSQGVVLRSRLETSAREAVLLLATPADPALLAELREGASIRLEATLDPRIATAAAVIPAGRRVRADGEWLPGAERRLFRNAVALDPRGQRLLFLSIGQNPGRARTVAPLAGLEGFLRQERWPDLFLLPDGEPLLRLASRGNSMEGAATQVRLALGVLPERKALVVPERFGTLRRIHPAAVQTATGSFPLNLPRAATDGRYAPDARLDQFWAAVVEPGRPADAIPTADDEPGVLRFLFSDPTPLAVVEVVHAEAAGFSPAFNLRAWRLIGRTRSDQPWRVLATVRHDTPVPRDRVLLEEAPRVQELRLVVDDPSFLPAGNVARVAEVIFWGR